MGLVNCVVPVEQLEQEGIQWAKEVLEKSDRNSVSKSRIQR
jgi:naphthoate synthase